MYGMEYSQIIHPSGRIKWQIGRIKKQLGMELVFSPPNTKLKKALHGIVWVASHKVLPLGSG